MVDPRYADLPLTQADWSNLLQRAQPQAQVQVQQAPTTPDTSNVPTPPVRAMSFAPQSVAPVPVAATPSANSPQMMAAMNDTSMYPLVPSVAMPAPQHAAPMINSNGSYPLAAGQDNRVPGNVAYPYGTTFPKMAMRPPITPSTDPMVTALLSGGGASGSW